MSDRYEVEEDADILKHPSAPASFVGWHQLGFTCFRRTGNNDLAKTSARSTPDSLSRFRSTFLTDNWEDYNN